MPGTGLYIMPGVTLALDNPGFGFANYGTILNNGTIDLQNSLTDYGVIKNGGVIIDNATMGSGIGSIQDPGTIDNYATFDVTGYYAHYPYNASAPNETGYLAGGNFANGAVFNNYGILNNTGVIQNFVIGNPDNSTFNNYGTFNNLDASVFQNRDLVNNNGTITNWGDFVNNGTIVNFCSGNFNNAGGGNYSGNAIIGGCGTTTIMTETTEESS